MKNKAKYLKLPMKLRPFVIVNVLLDFGNADVMSFIKLDYISQPSSNTTFPFSANAAV
jgi:hypothetical protein